jgi:hypothetical protein
MDKSWRKQNKKKYRALGKTVKYGSTIIIHAHKMLLIGLFLRHLSNGRTIAVRGKPWLV